MKLNPLLNEHHIENSIGDLLPVDYYYPEEGIFLCKSQKEKKNKHMAVSFIADPIPGGGSDNLNRSLHSLLTMDHKEDSIFSVMLFSHTNFKQEFDHYEYIRGDKARGIRKQICNDYTKVNRDFFEHHSYEPINGPYGLRVRDIRCWFTLKVPFKGKRPTKTELNDLYILSNQMLESMRSAGFYTVEKLTQTTYLEWMQTFLNWGKQNQWNSQHLPQVKAGVPLSHQIMDPGNVVHFNKDSVELTQNGSINDQRHIKMGSVTGWPEECSTALMQTLIGEWFDGTSCITDHFFFTMNIRLFNSKKELGKLARVYTNAKNQTFGPMGKWLKHAQKQKESFDKFYEVIKGGRLVETSIRFGINCESNFQANNSFSKMRTSFEKKGFQIEQERFFTQPMFLDMLPMGFDIAATKFMRRSNKHSSQQAVSLMPVCSEWKGTGTPVMQFVSRTGQLMNIDLWDSDTSYNAMIMATSGAGKSVLANSIIMNYMGSGKPKVDESGAKVYIIDVGRSYENTVAELGGTFIEFKANKKFSINPFSLIHGSDPQDLKEQISMIINIFAAMLDPSGVISALESSILMEYITLLFEQHGNELTVDHVGKALLQDVYYEHFCRDAPEKSVKDMGIKLMPFMENGVYGDFLSNKYPGIDLNDDLICLELEELKDKPELQTVVLMILISKIQYTMYIEFDGTRKLFILDEAWSFIATSVGGDAKNSQVAAFLETAYRRFRKYEAAGLIITQSCMDIARSDVGEVMFENTPNKFFLKQGGSALSKAEASNVLPYDKTTFEYLATVKTEKFKYSEIFFDTDRGSGIGRLFVPPYQLLLFSTDGDDKKAIGHYKDQGFNHAQAIKLVLKDRQVSGYENYDPMEDQILKTDMKLVS